MKNQETNVYELMHNVIGNDDLLEMIDNLLEFTEKALKEKNKNTIVKQFYERLALYAVPNYIFNNTKEKFIIYEGKDAISMFLHLELPKQKTPVKTLKEIQKMACNMKENFCNPIGKRIQKDEIYKIMDFLNTKYNFANKVFQDQRSIICMLEYSNKKYNSECLLTSYIDYVTQHFFLYHTNEKENIHPIAVFFHELGHALHVRFAKAINIIPEPILTFLKELCFPTIDTLTCEEKAEILADVFAMGLIFNSPFEQYDCFNKIDHICKKLFHKLTLEVLESVEVKNV